MEKKNMSRNVSVIKMSRYRGEEAALESENSHLSKEELVERVRGRLENMVSMLIEYPKDYSVEVTLGEKTICFKINCAQPDLGRILGRNGQMISSIRVVVAGITSKFGYRSIVELPFFPR